MILLKDYNSTNNNEKLLMLAVNIEDLEYADIGDILLYNEIPFTGLGYSLYSDGKLRELIPYKNGFVDGICREWYPNGRIKKECELKRGKSNGRKIYWNENGTIKSIANFELGIELDYQEWDEQGKLIKSRKLDTSNSNSKYELLLNLRDIENKREY